MKSQQPWIPLFGMMPTHTEGSAQSAPLVARGRGDPITLTLTLTLTPTLIGDLATFHLWHEKHRPNHKNECAEGVDQRIEPLTLDDEPFEERWGECWG